MTCGGPLELRSPRSHFSARSCAIWPGGADEQKQLPIRWPRQLACQMVPDVDAQQPLASEGVAARPPSDRTIAEEVARLVRTLSGEGSSRLDRASLALRLADAAERVARTAVETARTVDGASWTDVGAALGVTRQTAHERFRDGPDGGRSRLTRSH